MHYKISVDHKTAVPGSFTVDYQIGRTLGSGSFGVVHHGISKKDGSHVAIKIMSKLKLGDKLSKKVHDEIELLKILDHKNVIKLIDWAEDDTKIYIVMPLIKGGTLMKKLCEKKTFTEPDLCKVTRQLLKAVDYLHDHNIVHRDIKLENVMVQNNSGNVDSDQDDIILVDFGLAKKLDSDMERIMGYGGTFGYIAPESYTVDGGSKPLDIWSIGIVTYFLLTGQFPIESRSIPEFLAEVANNDFIHFDEDIWNNISNEGQDFIRRCLDVDFNRRPTAKELLNNHPWMRLDSPDGSPIVEWDNLLPKIRAGFDALGEFRKVINFVLMENMVKKLNHLDPFFKMVNPGESMDFTKEFDVKANDEEAEGKVQLNDNKLCDTSIVPNPKSHHTSSSSSVGTSASTSRRSSGNGFVDSITTTPLSRSSSKSASQMRLKAIRSIVDVAKDMEPRVNSYEKEQQRREQLNTRKGTKRRREESHAS